MSNPDDFLLGGGGKSAFSKDDPIGTTITGTIAFPPSVQQQTDIQSGDPLTWNNGDPKEQLVVTLQTDQRDDEDDDGQRKLYVKGSKKAGTKSLHDAVASAVKAAGAKGLAVGGTLTVQLVGTEPSATRGFSDRKLYAAKYVAPVTTADGFLDIEQPAAQAPVVAQAQPAAAAPAAPAPAAEAPAAPAAPVAAAQSPAELAKELLTAGLSLGEVVEATGLSTTAVTALKARM